MPHFASQSKTESFPRCLLHHEEKGRGLGDAVGIAGGIGVKTAHIHSHLTPADGPRGEHPGKRARTAGSQASRAIAG